MLDTLKVFLPRAVQDILTGLASILAAHGYINSSQEEQFIGAGFFLVMLVVNYFIAQSRKAAAATAGAAAVGAILSPASATLIAQGKSPP